MIPASPILAEVERTLSGKMGRELVLRKALKDARKQHDVVLIDCPPALGLLTINGLVASDWALISSEAQYFALQGVQGALDVIEQAKEFYNPDLEWLGVVMNIADMRTVHSREAYDQLAEHFGDKVYRTLVPRNVRLAEAPSYGLPGVVFDPAATEPWRQNLLPLLAVTPAMGVVRRVLNPLVITLNAIGNALMRLSAFLAAGGFREQLIAEQCLRLMEDRALGEALAQHARAGCDIGFHGHGAGAPDAGAVQLGRGSAAGDLTCRVDVGGPHR